MLPRKHVIGLGVLLTAATAFPALAQTGSGAPSQYTKCERAVTSTESEAAHAKYLSGKVDYDEGNYDSAISQFKQAYQKDCTKHDLLVIISAAYEKKGDRAEAVRALEAYIAFNPTSPDVPQYKAKIENLKRQIAAAPPSSAPLPSASASPSASSTASTTPPPPAEPVQEHTVGPWIVVGAGGIAVVTGVVLLATSPAFPDGCQRDTETCQRTDGESDSEFQKRQKDAGTSKGQTQAGLIVTLGGAALVAGGLLWHFLEPTGPKEQARAQKTRVTPAIGAGYAGVSVGGTF